MKKVFFWVMGIPVFLAALLAVLLLLLPFLLNLEPVKERILARFSEVSGGEAQYQNVAISLLPRPRVVIQGAKIGLPGKISAAADGLTIVPELIPLLRGKIRINLVQAEAPAVAMELPAAGPGEDSPGFSIGMVADFLRPLLAGLESKAPRLTLLAENGRLTLTRAGQPVFRFEQIQGRAHFPPDQLRVDLACQSNLWEHVSLEARLDSRSLDGTVSLRAKGLSPQPVLDYLAPAVSPVLEGTRPDLTADLELDRGRAFRGKARVSSSSLTLQRGGKKWPLKGLAVNVSFHLNEARTTLSLEEFSLQTPRMKLSGELDADLAASLFRLKLGVREMNVSPAREMAMGLAGETEPAQTIFDILRGGEIHDFSFESRGRSAADLGRLENILIRGDLAGGRIHLSEKLTRLRGIDLDLTQARGSVRLSRGILEGKDLAAQWESARFSQGSLKLGLSGGDAPFRLEAVAEADLALLPPLLKRLVGQRAFAEEIDRFREWQGKGRARLILGESLKSIRPKVEVEELSLFVRYERIPYSLKIEGAQGGYDGEKVEVKNLKGTVGRSSFSDISAGINLGETPEIRLTRGSSSLVLEEVFAWLNSIEKVKTVLPEIRSLKGALNLSSINLKGPLTQPEKWDYRLDGEVDNLALEAPVLPGPLAVSAAKIGLESVQGGYAGGKIEVKNLTGAVGHSSFAGISARVSLGEAPEILVDGGRSSLALEEILAWLNTIGRVKAALPEIRSLSGVVTLSSMNLKGPLNQPGKWDYRLAGAVGGLVMEASLLPGPFTVPAAKFEVTPEKILLQDTRVNLLDASLGGSAAVSGWQRGLSRVEGTFQGDLGPKGVEWASARFQVPAKLRIRAPLSLSRSSLGWSREEGISFTGSWQWAGGPGVSLDLQYTPEALTVRRLLITDDGSPAEVGLKVQAKEVRLDFKGALRKATIDRILVKNEVLAGSIDGDFRSHFFIDAPMRSMARGTLAGEGLGLAPVPGQPLVLKSFTLEADGNIIRVRSAALDWEDRRVSLEGSVDLSPGAFLVDMDAAMDGLHWAMVKKILEPGERKAEGAPSEGRKFPPLRGRIGFKTPYFTYEQFTLKPLRLEAAFLPGGVAVTVLEAGACGISGAGTAKAAPGGMALDIQPRAAKEDLAAVIGCLTGGPSPITGTLNFSGRISGRGPAEDLLRSLQGPLEMEARDGWIRQESLVVKALEFLNLAELLRGEKDNPFKRGMDYKSLQAKGELKSGTLAVSEMILHASAMRVASEGKIDFLNRRIDLNVAVSPFKTVDWIVQRIPVVDRILEGTLITLPIRIHGDLQDPKIVPLAPSEVGSRLMGIMKRTLEVPFKFVHPAVKDLEKSRRNPSAGPQKE